MSKFILGCLAAVLLGAVVLVGALLYLSLGFAPVGADVKPGPLETRLVSVALHASVRRRAANVQNLQAPTDDTLIAGRKLYANNCIGCHGDHGKPSDFGALFYPPAPQFFQVGTKYSDAEIFWVAKHGIRRTGMTPQCAYSDDKLWLLAAFVKRASNLSPRVLARIQQEESK